MAKTTDVGIVHVALDRKTHDKLRARAREESSDPERKKKVQRVTMAMLGAEYIRAGLSSTVNQK